MHPFHLRFLNLNQCLLSYFLTLRCSYVLPLPHCRKPVHFLLWCNWQHPILPYLKQTHPVHAPVLEFPADRKAYLPFQAVFPHRSYQESFANQYRMLPRMQYGSAYLPWSVRWWHWRKDAVLQWSDECLQHARAVPAGRLRLQHHSTQPSSNPLTHLR